MALLFTFHLSLITTEIHHVLYVRSNIIIEKKLTNWTIVLPTAIKLARCDSQVYGWIMTLVVKKVEEKRLMNLAMPTTKRDPLATNTRITTDVTDSNTMKLSVETMIVFNFTNNASMTFVGTLVNWAVQDHVSFVCKLRSAPSVWNENINILTITVSCHVPNGRPSTSIPPQASAESV